MLLRSGVPARRRNATALDGNATHELACRKTGNSSAAGERDVLWTDAGFSAAFLGQCGRVVRFQLKIGATARAECTGAIESYHASLEPCILPPSFFTVKLRPCWTAYNRRRLRATRKQIREGSTVSGPPVISGTHANERAARVAA